MNTSPITHERRALPTGTRVQEFEILSVLGGGGFGIVYLAQDHSLRRRVALKEYMPPLASRMEGSTQVMVSLPHDNLTFGVGLRSFVNEARLLARFDHPGLVKVHRFWEENGTAYMAMPFYEGSTLRKGVSDNRVPTDEVSLRRLLAPLLEALAALHREHCVHRDISPDNILLTTAGPVLLDFGAARLALEDGSQSFTVILKEGYAPVEQYATEDATAMRQGPWTDIYALAAVMRYVITGQRPPASVTRLATLSDPMEPLARLLKGRYSDPFLQALDRSMALQVEQRPQSIEELRVLLSHPPSTFEEPTLLRQGPARAMVPVPGTPPGVTGDATLTALVAPAHAGVDSHRPGTPGSHRYWALALMVPLAVAAAVGVYRLLPQGRPGPAPALPAPPASLAAAGGVAAAGRSAKASASPARERTVASAGRDRSSAPVSRSAEGDASSRSGAEAGTAGGAQREGVEASAPAGPAVSTLASQREGAGPEVLGSREERGGAGVAAEAGPEGRGGPFGRWRGALGRQGTHALNPALMLLLRAARAGSWEAVERRAMLLARTVEPPPVGDRAFSRRANERGLAALREHRLPESLAAFELGVGADPSDIEVANNYGYALAMAGRRADAQEILTGVLLRDPARSVAWTALAEARSDERGEALAALRLALHFAASREKTLARFREMAQTHADPRVRELVSTVLQESAQVPTVPEGLP